MVTVCYVDSSMKQNFERKNTTFPEFLMNFHFRHVPKLSYGFNTDLFKKRKLTCSTKQLTQEDIYGTTVEPHKEVRYLTKPSDSKVILLIPALYIFVFYPDIMRNLIEQGNFHGP